MCYYYIMEKFVERLKYLRLEKGVSQAQLAIDTGLTISAISKWENGKRIPSALAIIILAKYFNVTTDYLLGVAD